MPTLSPLEQQVEQAAQALTILAAILQLQPHPDPRVTRTGFGALSQPTRISGCDVPKPC